MNFALKNREGRISDKCVLGRPPTPPAHHGAIIRNPETLIQERRARAPVANTRPNMAQGGVSSRRTTTPAKIRPKGNTSILSFFKKTTPPGLEDDEDGLFFTDKTGASRQRNHDQFPTPPREPEITMPHDSADRFNEEPGPVKRRRTASPETRASWQQYPEEEETTSSVRKRQCRMFPVRDQG
jgi:hypothetical protein